MRKRITYANVVATLALVFAMSGGALAANHYLISSTNQLSPKVLKKLKGRAGKTGKTGATGKSGATGAAGAPGAAGGQGPPGPFVANLPSGQSLRGVYSDRASAGAAGQDMQIPITFAFPISAPPATHYVVFKAAPPAECPGTPEDPKATPGNFCVYESEAVINGEDMHVFDPISGDNDTASRFGSGVIVTAKAAGDYRVRGSWAVTAP